MRVYCRVKPIDIQKVINSDETQQHGKLIQELKSSISVSDAMNDSQLPICLDLQNGKESLTFHFDGVFPPGAS